MRDYHLLGRDDLTNEKEEENSNCPPIDLCRAPLQVKLEFLFLGKGLSEMGTSRPWDTAATDLEKSADLKHSGGCRNTRPLPCLWTRLPCLPRQPRPLHSPRQPHCTLQCIICKLSSSDLAMQMEKFVSAAADTEAAAEAVWHFVQRKMATPILQGSQ